MSNWSFFKSQFQNDEWPNLAGITFYRFSFKPDTNKFNDQIALESSMNFLIFKRRPAVQVCLTEMPVYNTSIIHKALTVRLTLLDAVRK